MQKGNRKTEYCWGFLGIFMLLIFAYVVFAGSASAAGVFKYQLLESIPGVGETGDSIDLPSLVVGIYKFGISTVGIAALFMMSVGGFMYVTSAGNTSSAGTAKSIIVDSLLGLFIALASWGLLYIINPDLVGPDAASPNIFSGQLSTNAPLPTTPEQVAIMNQRAQDLGIPDLAGQVKTALGGKLTTSGSCKDTKGAVVSPASNIEEIIKDGTMTICNSSCPSTPCSQKVIPNKKMLLALLSMSSQIERVNSIGGGAHSPESAHYKGNAVDLRFPGASTSWQPYVDNLTGSFGAYAPQTFCDKGGKAVRAGGLPGGKFDCAGKTVDGAVGDHVHADFRNS